MPRMLVLFGTTDGQTKRIALAVAGTLAGQGVKTDVVDAREESPDPASYDGVIVAASVHAGGYQKCVRRWVHRYASRLRDRPTAFVSVCLGVLQHDPKVDAAIRAILDKFLAATGWMPLEQKIVAGALPYSRYNVVKRWVMRRIAAKAGGDTDTSRDYEYTDWQDLEAFARGFAARVIDRAVVSASRHAEVLSH